jgi:hypothetical protein
MSSTAKRIFAFSVLPVITKSTITSASPTTLYGKDMKGTAMKTDELMQSPWSNIDGFLPTKMKSVLGQNDKAGLYGIDTYSKVFHCEGDCSIPQEFHPVDTGGYMPLELSPDSPNLWMTTTTSGPVGNIFTQVEKPDYSSIMNNINPLEQQRDKIVSDIGEEYNKQTGVMTVNKQVSDIETFFKKIFGDQHKSTTTTKNASGNLQKLIVDQQATLEQLTSVQPIISGFVYTLIAVVVIYLIGSILGSFIHWIAFVVLLGGIYLTINNGFGSISALWSGLFKTA